MTKVKRVMNMVLATLMMAACVALPASANTASETMTARINGGSTISSAASTKQRSGNMTYTALPSGADGWSSQGDEWVYFRGRSGTNSSQATTLDHRNYSGSSVRGSLGYYDGYGLMGYPYKMAISYDNSNPYEYVRLGVAWTA